MISVDVAIHRVRRDITLAVVLKALFFLAIVGSLWIGPSYMKALALTVVAVSWVWLSVSSARNSQIAAGSPSLIASGQFDEAERQIDKAMRTFSLFRAAKLQSLHQLAMLRHAQQRWQESAALCRALLGQRLGVRSLSRASRLILAESLLEMNDLNGAYQAIMQLYQERLPLREAMMLLAVQVDYEAKIGAWGRIMNAAPTKVQLAEMMPAIQAARVQSLLGLAAMRVGRTDWADWLRSRVEMLVDVQALCAQRPMLCELWGRNPDANAGN